MENLPIIRSPRSEFDLVGIWFYIARHNPSAASALLRKIDRKIQLLASSPQLGELQPQFGPNVRRIVVDKYLVFYQALDDCVRVMRIFHSARKWEDLL